MYILYNVQRTLYNMHTEESTVVCKTLSHPYITGFLTMSKQGNELKTIVLLSEYIVASNESNVETT